MSEILQDQRFVKPYWIHLDFEGADVGALKFFGHRLLHLEDFIGPLGSTLDREKFKFFKDSLDRGLRFFNRTQGKILFKLQIRSFSYVRGMKYCSKILSAENETNQNIFQQYELNRAVTSCNQINIDTKWSCPPQITCQYTVPYTIPGPSVRTE